MVNPQKTTMDNLTGVFYVGLLEGCWGVLGLLIVMKWIIPENSLRKTHQ